jgi:hypothetical protein
MFYWEYRLGTWHSSLLLESDIAHDTYVIYNAREIIQKLLSIPVSDQLNATVLKRLVKKHWPVLNYWQENNTQTVDFFDPQFDRNGILLTPFEVVSGSTVDSARTVPVYLKVQEHRAKFFIDINNPKKGDYVEFIKHIPVVPGSGTMLILQLRSPYQNSRVRERLIYKVLVDDAVIAQEDISDWKESNVIQMCWVPDREKVKVSVRVEALTNCELHNWGTAGTILIEKIQVTDFSKALEFSVHATSPFTTLSSSI